MENKKYICHSGGCSGSDMEWEIQGREYNIPTIAYSFKGHIQEGKYAKILTEDELLEGWKHVQLVEKSIKRPLYKIKHNTYVKNLLCRNWFQVKNADAIYAIGSLVEGSDKLVDGGTGWAVQMAIKERKPVWLFEQNLNQWFYFYQAVNKFVEVNSIPLLTENFAGIGTRQINENGKQAIKEIYKHNIKCLNL